MWQARVDVRARFAGQDYINTFMYERGQIVGRVDGANRLALDPQLPAMSTVDATGLFNGFVNLFQSRYENLCTTDWHGTEIRITGLSPNEDFRQSWTFPISWTGTAAPPAVPPGQAAIITRRPNPGQRGFNGRLYMGAFPLLDVVDGVVDPDSGTFTFLQAIATALSTPVGDPAIAPIPAEEIWWPMVIKFRRFDPLHYTFPGISLVNALCVVKRPLRSYRRRRPGHGRTG